MLDVWSSGLTADGAAPRGSPARQRGFKRLVKGSNNRESRPDQIASGGQEIEEPAPPQSRPKTGLRLKIKFGGADWKVQVGDRTSLENNTVTCKALGLSIEEWLGPAKEEWKELRSVPPNEKMHSIREQQLTEHSRELPMVLDKRVDQQAPSPLDGHTSSLDIMPSAHAPESTAAIPAALPQPAPLAHSPENMCGGTASADQQAPGQPDPEKGKTDARGLEEPREVSALQQKHQSCPEEQPPGAPAENLKQGDCSTAADATGGEDKEPGEASPAAQTSSSSTSTSSSSSSSSSDSSEATSDTDSERSRKRRRRGSSSSSVSRSRSRSRSREPGEHSDSMEDPRKRQRSEWSRSPPPGRSRHQDRDGLSARHREPDRARYGRSGYYERYSREPSEPRRLSREPGKTRSWEYERREQKRRYRPDDAARSLRRTSSRELRGSREGSYYSRAATRERSPRPPSHSKEASEKHTRLQEEKEEKELRKRSISPDAAPHGSEKRHKRSRSVEPKKEETPLQAAPPPPQPPSFADAWKLLQGSCEEELPGTEADIERLRQEATKAKHSVESIPKGSDGKHSLETLVSLMRDSFLKYMQLCIIWEGMLRAPNTPPTRTRAKLADEGGVYPCTIGLVRTISNDARACCSESPEPARLLRILAEKLVAIMQLRLVQVQRGKVQQDKQILLACRGAPTSIDSFGRLLPGAAVDVPGETFQRPSPTDSNASNSTGELSVTPVAAGKVGQAGRGTPPPGKPHQARPAACTALPRGQQGKAGQAGRGVQRGVGPRGTPTREQPGKAVPSRQQSSMAAPARAGRDDAWAVDPPVWEIPQHKVEHVTRSWSLLGGVAAFTGQFQGHAGEIRSLMSEGSSPAVQEAAAMLSFLDVGLGMSSMSLLLQLSNKILDLISQVAAAGKQGKQEAPPLPPGSQQPS